jgi:hypothetical protein
MLDFFLFVFCGFASREQWLLQQSLVLLFAPYHNCEASNRYRYNMLSGFGQHTKQDGKEMQ